MTERDAAEWLEKDMTLWRTGSSSPAGRALTLAISALREVAEYRAVGTVEECKIAVCLQGAKRKEKL